MTDPACPRDDTQDDESTLGEQRRDVPILVVAWHDSFFDPMPGALQTNSDEALFWWTPLLGPTAMLMAHRFAGYAAVNERTTFTLGQIAETFGLGSSVRKAVRSIARLERFGIVTVHDGVLAVRMVLPPLTRRLHAQLPQYLTDHDHPFTPPSPR